MTLLTTRLNYREAMKLDLPEMDIDGIKVVRFTVDKEASRFNNLRAVIGGGRGSLPPGEYTKVLIDGRLWMSDTPDEMSDHAQVFWQVERRGGRVLINGLGAGMILNAILKLDNVEHVDVVEIDPRILKHIAPHYADERVTFHEADAYEIQWPVGTRWDVVWHDIWLDLTGDNLPGMHKLHRRYGRRCDWQASWGREFIEYQQSRTRGWGGF